MCHRSAMHAKLTSGDEDVSPCLLLYKDKKRHG